MTKLDINKFIPAWGDWSDKIAPFFTNGGFDPIFDELRALKSRGKMVLPASEDLFRCFRETKLSELKVVVCGLGPYHTLKNGKIIADGLALSCSNTMELQPSLENWYNAASKELVKKADRDSVFYNPDLKYLANQGVLLFNASLTTELFKAGSHIALWSDFMKYIFEEIFAVAGIPILYLGKDAGKLKKYTAPMQWNIEVEHPAAVAHRGGGDWDNQKCFSKICKIVKDANGYDLQWLEMLPF
jgi:uracil DNA glycosylase